MKDPANQVAPANFRELVQKKILALEEQKANEIQARAANKRAKKQRQAQTKQANQVAKELLLKNKAALQQLQQSVTRLEDDDPKIQHEAACAELQSTELLQASQVTYAA